MLYDATRCIGCQSCVFRCREANRLTYTPDEGHLYDAPRGLDGHTMVVIKEYREGARRSFVKAQCMHCVEPACVSVCRVGAMVKSERGIVTYQVDRCVGCRYCEVACPFDVPQLQMDEAAPRVVKCEMCAHLQARGKQPACCDGCPCGAVIFGSLDEMKKQARARLAQEPMRYVPRVYGDAEAFGTQVLYLAGVPFEKLGLPSLDDSGVPDLTETVVHQGLVVPAVLFAALGTVLWRKWRREREAER
jgi:Fe-S-cluster-containing dehydrogenase component